MRILLGVGMGIWIGRAVFFLHILGYIGLYMTGVCSILTFSVGY